MNYLKDLYDYVRNKEIQIEKVSEVRQHNETKRIDNTRSEADKDYARVLYSSSFRRLQGKMQLLIPDNNLFYRNRLTHSLEVAQISRSLATILKLKDTITVQTCSLAHDIGNPPFGHYGEIILNQLDINCRYEGNAQTYRILTHLEEKFHNCNGLDLTLRTILGTVKYFNNFSQNKDKFLYDLDYIQAKDWCDHHKIDMKTIDCEIMDISDEIAYAAHDLEDCLKLKLFNIDEIIYELSKSKFNDSVPKFLEIVDDAKEYSSHANTYGTSEEYSIYFLKKVTSSLVNTLVRDIGLVNDNGVTKLGYLKYRSLSKGLKSVVFNALSRDKEVYQYEKLGEKVLTGLFEVFSDGKYNKDLKLLPAEYRISEKNRTHEVVTRTILDYIGGMMDSYAIESYKQYFGMNSLDRLYYES